MSVGFCGGSVSGIGVGFKWIGDCFVKLGGRNGFCRLGLVDWFVGGTLVDLGKCCTEGVCWLVVKYSINLLIFCCGLT